MTIGTPVRGTGAYATYTGVVDEITPADGKPHAWVLWTHRDGVVIAEREMQTLGSLFPVASLEMLEMRRAA